MRGAFRLFCSSPPLPRSALADPAPLVSGDNIPPEVAALIAEIQAKPVYDHATWGIRLVDPATGEILIDQAGEKSMAPGSIMKVYSVATGLDTFGPDYRFHTPVYRTGDVTNGVLAGNLVLVASGDFSFGLRDQPDGTLAFNSLPEIDHNYADTGFPGADRSSRAATRSPRSTSSRPTSARPGITEIDGDVAIDDRLFDTYQRMERRADLADLGERERHRHHDDPDQSRRAGDDRLASEDGRDHGRRRGEDGARAMPTPITVETAGPACVKVSGEIAAGGPPILVISQIPDPASFARTAFIEALERAGVTVKAEAAGPNPTGILPDAAATRTRQGGGARLTTVLGVHQGRPQDQLQPRRRPVALPGRGEGRQPQLRRPASSRNSNS